MNILQRTKYGNEGFRKFDTRSNDRYDNKTFNLIKPKVIP
jgi:hypothetical protein